MADRRNFARDGDKTFPLGRGGDHSDGGFALLIVGDGVNLVYELPPGGAVTLGRSPECDVHIDHRSISRRHAVLEIGPPLRLRDEGSANGSFVRQQRLPASHAVEVAPGDAIELGAVTVVIQRRDGSHPAPRLPPSVRDALPAMTPAARATLPPRPPSAGATGAAGTGIAPVVSDPAMVRIYELVARVAASPISVLLLGETGVGKEVVAEALHRGSPRAGRPYVRLNCAALAPALLESELFGHEKGAFTGADTAKPGLLEVASGGTVFLDEVGELPLTLQVKLLRVLEERAVLRVGALAPRPVDVRFVAATNRDLRAEAERGVFRQDLYFRLNGLSIEIPPLRARPGEIAVLARAFAARAAGSDRPAPVIDPAALDLLTRYGWPGNVRELRNAIERAVLLGSGSTIEPAHLPPEILAAAPRAGAGAESNPAVAAAPLPSAAPMSAAASREEPAGRLPDAVAAFERQQIVDALARCGGNQTRAAELLGIPRRTLVAKIRAFQIPGRRARGDDDGDGDGED